MKNSPIGTSWKKYKETRMTPEERNELKIKTDIVCEILEARHSQGLTQKQLEAVSGVKQPVIARMEAGSTDPQLTTILKVLAPLGKTLAVVPMDNKDELRV